MQTRGDISAGLNARCGFFLRKKPIKQKEIYETPGKPNTKFNKEEEHEKKQPEKKHHEKKHPEKKHQDREMVEGPEAQNAVVLK